MRPQAKSLQVAPLAVAVALLSQPLRAAPDVRGFSYCAPPVRPACIEKSVSALAMAACDEDVQRFTRMVFGYRECLEREMERAVRGANDAIEAWRCRRDRTKCRK